VTNETLSPTIRVAILINSKRTIVTAGNRFNTFDGLTVLIKHNSFWEPVRLLVTNTNLSIGIETPHIKRTFRSQSCGVPKACRTSNNLGLFAVNLIGELDHLGSSYFSMSA